MSRQPTPDELKAIEAEILAGNKIAAIKLHREATGLGLKDSKDWVEAHEGMLRGQSPEKFSAPAKSGCVGLVAFGLVGGIVLLNHLA